MDEACVSEFGYCPYGWQFPDENVHIKSQRGKRLNVLGLYSSTNDLRYMTTDSNINGQVIVSFLDDFSLSLEKETVIVLDNASAHRSQVLADRLTIWQSRGLYLFYLPPYSPHLNKIERLWWMLKMKWLRPEDYNSTDQLFYATNLALMAVGSGLSISF